jgi:hypothetical protein
MPNVYGVLQEIEHRLANLELSIARMLGAVKDLVHLHTHLPEQVIMTLRPEIQAAVDRVKEAIAAEAQDIKAKVQAAIDAINAGSDTADVVASLDDIATRIGDLSETVLPAAEPAPPEPPTP